MQTSTRKTDGKRVVIVSNRLPVSVAKKDGALKITPSVGGFSLFLNLLHL